MIQEAASLPLTEALRRTAARVPHHPALLSEHRQLTWSELEAESARLAALLQQMGVGPGDVVGFLIDKRPEVVTGFLACCALGAVMAPVNFKLNPAQVADQFVTAKISAVVTQRSREGLLDALGPLAPPPGRILYVDTPCRAGARHYSEQADLSPISPHPDVTVDTVCYFNYTSGTTGRPKGAVTTHRHIQLNAVSTIEALGFTAQDIFLGMFSVFAHPHELFHRSLVVGGAFAILDAIAPRRIAAMVERFRVTWMMAVPSFYEMMLDYAAPPDATAESEAIQGKHDLSSLRVLESGGAYVGSETLARMESAFRATFVPVWGCTEATGVAIANGPGSWRRPGATGRILPHYALRVVDDQGSDVPPGQVGELLLQSDAIADAYVNQPEETAQAFLPGGWYRTQDLVRQDAEGFVYFAGRRSEMLKIGGIRVYPLEIEQSLKQHPDVREVVVVRAEERLRGEIARAIVETIPGSALSVRDVQAWCRDHLASYKVPRVVEFWKEIPRLPNGKVDKQAILAVAMDADRDER